MTTESIAVIGIGCRFPGEVHGPSQFFSLLRKGGDAITGFPPERSRLFGAGPPPGSPAWGGFLSDIDGFDAEFFRISPREADYIDPQQRLLLEVSWEALEHAAIDPRRLAGSETGVFVGMMAHDYERLLSAHPLGPGSPYFFTGTSPSTACGRIAHFFDFHGPALAVDTASSSSLVAVHLACRALSSGECSLALAAGVNLILSPDISQSMAGVGVLSSSGRSRGFDRTANGYVRGEGCGVVVLKRLADAVADGNTIFAVVRGSAVNQDGASEGLMAPSGPAQQALLHKALANAGLQPGDITYVEAHGTGTPLGDVTEGQALGEVFGSSRARPLLVGSVKSNVGHLEGAAGIAGFIKAALSLHHRFIPAHLHFTEFSAQLAAANLRVPAQGLDFPGTAGSPRRVGVSSFGIAGSNSHVILEEAPPAPPPSGTAPLPILPLSAQSPEALRELARCHADRLRQSPADWPAVCATAQVGRAHLKYRTAVVARSPEAALDELSRIGTTAEPDAPPPRRAPRIAFLYTGGGAQYPMMGRALYESNATFREALDRCDGILRGLWDRSLLELLYSAGTDSDLLQRMEYMQPALFAIGYALTELWGAWGVRPDIVLGHSLGEYGAACAAGVMSLSDALTLVCKRGRLLSTTAAGEMAALSASEAELAAVLRAHGNQLSVAAVNGAKSVVLSGSRDALRQVIQQLGGVEERQLEISCAAHSPLMEPILDELEAAARHITLSPPRICYVSSLFGRVVSEQLIDPVYWRRHTRETVRFMDALFSARSAGADIFIEMGPKPVLITLGQEALQGDGLWLPSLKPPGDDVETILSSLAGLYRHSVELDWTGIAGRAAAHRRVELPSYPFQRRRFFVPDAAARTPSAAVAPTLAGVDLPTADSPATSERVPAAGDSASIRGQIERADEHGRAALIAGFVEEKVRSVLRIAAGRPLPGAQLLRELGLDSLLAAELSRHFERSLQVAVPARRILSEGSVQSLTALLQDKLTAATAGIENPQASSSVSVPVSAPPASQAPSDFHGASEEIPQIHAIVTEQHGRQVLVDGRWVDDLASCNYLGLDQHPGVIAEVLPAIEKWGVHPSWTRAVASPVLYEELEQELATFLKAPSVLMFPSVTLLHAGVLPVLAGYDGIILKDVAAHRSIHEGCLLAQAQGAELQEFRHNDPVDLELKLALCASKRTKIIAIDGVYSMSGAYPPLVEFARLAKKYDALVYLDDAHGLGVVGERPSQAMPYGHFGNGIVNYFGLDYVADRLVYVAGLSKSFSSYGAFVVCHDAAMKQKLRSASTWIFSGPSPVASLASALAGVRYNRLEGEAWRAQIFKLVFKLVSGAKDMGFSVVNENYFPIVGVVIGQTQSVIAACKILWAYRSLITPALYPIVPHDRGLLRFSITATNTEAEIDRALAGLAAISAQILGQGGPPKSQFPLYMQEG